MTFLRRHGATSGPPFAPTSGLARTIRLPVRAAPKRGTQRAQTGYLTKLVEIDQTFTRQKHRRESPDARFRLGLSRRRTPSGLQTVKPSLEDGSRQTGHPQVVLLEG